MSQPGEGGNEAALRRALSALERMQARLTASQQAAREPIAVVGLGCRFPGSRGPEGFADFLQAQGNAICEVPDPRARWFAAAESPAARRAGFFQDIASFDPGRFGLSDAEALAMDPHQRLMLEVAWEALADADVTLDALRGSRGGVYLALGAQNSDFAWWWLHDRQRLDGRLIGGSFHSLMPGRLSYLLDWRGPSVVLDAACASALTALHWACQSLRQGEIPLALVAAVNLVLSPLVSHAVARNGLLSPTASCRSFDASADGFVRGEGVGVLVLKRLSDALAANDRPWALILGSAIGQDGHGNGLSAPHGPAQAQLLRQALAVAGVSPAAVGYVEAHATGTRLGDAIEAQALGAIYGSGRDSPLRVGAVKPNLGHLEAASGMAGLLKVIMALQRRIVPPTLHLSQLNPDIDAEDLGLEFVTRQTDWSDQAQRLAGVSAFGMSGAGAHVIVAPAAAPRASRPLEPAFQRRRLWPDDLNVAAPFLPVATDAASPQVAIEQLLYQVAWRPAEQTPGKIDSEPLFLLGDVALLQRLAPDLTRSGYRVCTDGIEALADAQPGRVLYLVDALADSGLAALRRHYESVLKGLLDLVQQLAERAGWRLCIVTRGGWEGAAAAAMALAMGRVIALEHPELGCRRIDLQPALAAPAAALAAELARSDGEEWVRLTADKRLAARLTPLPVTGEVTFAARPDAAYAITGGMGGIGQALAGWLLEQGARHVILLGRRRRACPQLAAWTARGCDIRLVTLDVTHAGELEAWLAGLDAEGLPLAGVFHLAGETADALLSVQRWTEFAKALRAKVEGAWTLHQLTRERALDCFVLFSSITTLCGLAGTGAYATANAALGALARLRHRQGLPALCIEWGTWAESGMVAAADAALRTQWQSHGLLPFASTSGLGAMAFLLGNPGLENAVVAHADWARLAGWARTEGSGAEFYAELLPALPETPSVDNCADQSRLTAPELEAVVRAAVAETVGLHVEDATLDRSFGELGLNSLAAIALRNRLAQQLHRSIPATLAFNHPSVAAIVRYLSARCDSVAQPPAPGDVQRRLELMTEQEAADHLTGLLADLESKVRK